MGDGPEEVKTTKAQVRTTDSFMCFCFSELPLRGVEVSTLVCWACFC